MTSPPPRGKKGTTTHFVLQSRIPGWKGEFLNTGTLVGVGAESLLAPFSFRCPPGYHSRADPLPGNTLDQTIERRGASFLTPQSPVTYREGAAFPAPLEDNIGIRAQPPKPLSQGRASGPPPAWHYSVLTGHRNSCPMNPSL